MPDKGRVPAYVTRGKTWTRLTEVQTHGGSVLGKGGLQRKWCAPAAMEPIVGASRAGDSVEY